MNGEQGKTSKSQDSVYYEIEYDTTPFQGVGRYVLKPSKITPPPKDEIRTLFSAMQEIARAEMPSVYDYTRFFDRRVRDDNARVFYKQAQFMADFTDNYGGFAPFSQYFPSFRLMSYDQLRTYFTWRTRVREGNIADVPISYAFLYIYELLSNIGMASPAQGLSELMRFWRAFREFRPEIDKYVLRWLKDYHIYYEPGHSFNDFIKENDLAASYPAAVEVDGDFELYRSVSKYNIEKSKFYTKENRALIEGAFAHALVRMRSAFDAGGIDFDDALFRPTKKLMPWQPFKDALFFPFAKQRNRAVVFSANEIYIARDNRWYQSSVLTTEKGRLFVGYMMKKTESLLRALTGYKYKLGAEQSMIHEDSLRVLEKAGVDCAATMEMAVGEFYREATKTVVTVDRAVLDKLRDEARRTTRALTVEEGADPEVKIPCRLQANADIFKDDEGKKETEAAGTGDTFETPRTGETVETDETVGEPCDIWAEFGQALSQAELAALRGLLRGESIRALADAAGTMAEVFAEGINEKAADILGDNLLDDRLQIYDEYTEKIKETVG